MKLFKFILDLIFPKLCLGCGRWGRYFCGRCVKMMQIIETRETICPVCQKGAISGLTHPKCGGRGRLDGLTSLFHYTGAVKRAIHDLKYRGVTDLIGELTEIIHRSMSHNFISQQGRAGQPIICIPIPLYKDRLRMRGFNQAELVARIIAQQFSWPVRTDLLIRTRATTPQVEMKKRAARLANTRGVFAVKSGVKFPSNTTVILVDDVYTTGATLGAAAKVLKTAGATWVWAMTLAR